MRTTLKQAGFLLGTLLLLTVTGAPASTEDPRVLETEAVRVVYETGARYAAERIAALSPSLLEELEAATGLKADFRATVIPVPRREDFRRMGGEDAFIAFARPAQNLIVMDLSRFEQRPASLPPVLKHEFSHLLLHRHIPEGRLPRWLDEGIAQHLSDGLSEYLPGQQDMILGEALAAGRVPSLGALEARFPGDDFGLQLAYEQSRSIVGYMAKRYSDTVMIPLLTNLANGMSAEEAWRAVSGISLARLEAEWRQHQASPLAWLGRMAGHVYGVVFFLAALATLLGYRRHRRRRRNYVDEEDDIPEAC